MLSNKWMIISLLIGNILLCSMVASIPLYSDAILQRMLTKQLEQQQLETNRYPASAEIKFASLSVNRGYELQSLGVFESRIAQFSEELALPLAEKVSIYSSTAARAELVTERQSLVSGRMLKLEFMSGIADHIEVTSGSMFSGELAADGAIEVIVNERTLVEQDLLIGELLELKNLTHSNGKPVTVKVVGTYKNNSDGDIYWYYSPATFSDTLIMDESLFRNLFISNYQAGFNFTANWYVMFEYTAITQTDVERILEVSELHRAEFSRYGTTACRLNYTDTLTRFTSESSRLGITLWVLQVPIFVLLAFFVFMVSKQILEQEKNSIAVIKSRGASRMQVMLIFVGQSAIISSISYVAGVPLGVLICRILGASNGFLGLVQRSALSVRLVPEAFIYTLGAAVLSILTMVVPAFAYSKVTIVDHKRATNKKNVRPLWQKLFIDVILLGISLYGLYTYNNQKAALASGTAASLDPLLFISSSLFIIGAGLLFLRIFPLVVRLIFAVGKRFWPPALYASFIKVTRSMGEEQFIMLFLVLTVATGIFNAKAARTINLNMEHNIQYNYGTDIVLMEEWRDNSLNENAKMILYTEPDFEKYKQLDQSKIQITKVQNTTSGVAADNLKGVRLMGIDTKQFGEIAWFRDDMLPVHWYNYLNAMTSDARAVLVSMNFHTKQGYNLGDSISLRNSNGMFFSGKICGFVDYWPTYDAVTIGQDRKGQRTETDNFLVIANLAQVQSAWGVMPYQLWMKTDSPSLVYDFAGENELKFTIFRDSAASIVEQKNDPVLQGTNGVLTVGFIIILVVCMTGFLIYWVLSIRSRTLQFGIFRAMGMSMKNVLAMLANEQVFISGVSIGIGAVVGLISSALYVPLIQLGYAAGANSTPLVVIAENGDYIRLFTIIGIMLVVCMVVLGMLISKIKIAQALKLGED